jgi:hypothetical protein
MRVLACCLAFTLSFAALVSGQLNRGSITGTVTDPTGSAVPAAQVTLKNTETGAAYETLTNPEGQYTVPNLPTGSYEVTVGAAGFKTSVRTGLVLQVTEVLRADVRLEVGSTTDSVQVTAAVARLQSDSPEVGAVIQNKQLADLPFSFSGSRLIENLVYRVAPGVTGNRWANNINGSVNFTRDSLIDGASASTFVQGASVQITVSLEAVQEFKVQSSGMAAEFGRTSSGVMNYVLKSGTNELHGSLYGSIRNEALNANNLANKTRGAKRPVDRKINYALSSGAPIIIPKIYDGHNKTFFYVAFEHYRDRNLIFGSPNITAPLPEFYDGDFSRLLGTATGQTDALGRQVMRGAIYDPATFRQLDNGRWVGEAFPGNRIPVSRFSQVSRNLNELLRSGYLPTVRDASGQIPLVNNALFPTNVIPNDTSFFFSVKGDHFINTRHKLSGSYARAANPRLLINQGGLWELGTSTGGPLARAVDQFVNGTLGRAAYDWTISPTKLNHMTLSFNRFSDDAAGTQADLDGAAALGIRGLKTIGYPEIDFSGGPFVNLDTVGRANKGFTANNSYGILDNFSLYHGRHFMKAGFDIRRNERNNVPTQGGVFRFNPRGTAIPNESFAGNLTGFSFASYLLGIVDSAQLSDPVGLGGRRMYYGVFFQDDFKVNNRLTLNLGIRWEHQPPVAEQYDRLSSWNPAKLDPETGRLGAYDFAGNCSLCTGKRSFGRPSYRDLAPRFGFAFRPRDKWTLRGAYGFFFASDIFNGTGPTPLGKPTSVQAGGTFVLEPDPVQPWAGIFNWDSGFPQNRYVPATYDLSWGNRNRPAMIDPDYGRTGYTQQWNLNVQRELPGRFVLDAGYVGNKSTGLYAGSLANYNQLPASELTQYGRALNNAVRTEAEAAANNVAYPYAGFRGTVASALRPHPQVQGNQTLQVYGSPLGFTSYHALQVVMNREWNNGLTLYSSWVWSKAMQNMRSLLLNDNPGRPLDYYNLQLEKSLAEQDRPHFFKLLVQYELPVGKGRALWSGANTLQTAILGGWQVSALVNYASGIPLNFQGSFPLTGGWNGVINRVNVAPGDLRQSGFDDSNFNFASPSSPSNTYLDKSKFSDPAPLTLGTSAYYYNQARGFGVATEDIALQKNWYVGNERVRFQFRADLLNAFNRHYPGGINTNVTNPLFGQVTSVGGQREIQFGLRIDF